MASNQNDIDQDRVVSRLGAPLTSSATDSSANPSFRRTTFLSLPDELQFMICESLCTMAHPNNPWLTLHHEKDCSEGALFSLLRTNRHLFALVLPLLWNTVIIDCARTAGLVLSCWIRRPDTRLLVRRLYCCDCDEDAMQEVFLRSLPSIGLAKLEELRIQGDVRPYHVSDMWANDPDIPLKILDVSLDEGFDRFDDDDDDGDGFGEGRLPTLQDLRLKATLNSSIVERTFGLKNLTKLRIFVTDGEQVFALSSLQVVTHYLPQLQHLFFGGYLEDSGEGHRSACRLLMDYFWDLESEERPLLRTVMSNSLPLFRRQEACDTAPITSLLRWLVKAPNLRRLHFEDVREFAVDNDDIKDWVGLELPSVTTIIMGISSTDTDVVPFLCTTRAPTLLVAFIRLFPNLQYLRLFDCFPSETYWSDLAAARTLVDCGFRSPPFLVFALSLLDSQITMIRLDGLRMYRKDASVREWERELMHDL